METIEGERIWEMKKKRGIINANNNYEHSDEVEKKKNNKKII